VHAPTSSGAMVNLACTRRRAARGGHEREPAASHARNGRGQWILGGGQSGQRDLEPVIRRSTISPQATKLSSVT